MRVLHVLDKITGGSGVAGVVMNLIEHSDIKQDAAVYSDIDESLSRRVKKRGGNVYKVSDIKKGLGIPFGRDISALYKENKYTAVHGHILNSAFIYMKEAKRLNIPVRIIHSHNGLSAETFLKRLRNNLLQKNLTEWGTRFVAVSAAAARNAFGKSADKAVIIRNGIDAERFKFNGQTRKAVRKEFRLSDKTLCAGSAARFVPQKNHKFILEIAAKLPNAVFILAGDGPLLEKSKKAAPPNVRFCGTRADIENLYQAFDIFILPSLFEGFPLSAVEAQCSGLPCLVSDRVTKEIDFTGNVSFLPINDSDIWANAIRAAIQDTDRYGGFEKALSAGLDMKSVIESYEKMYREKKT